MPNRLTLPYLSLLIGLPLTLIAVLFLLTRSTVFAVNASRLAPAVTLDLVLTIPAVYFLLVRRTTIPNLTVIPVLIFGIFLAAYLLPEQEQYYPGMLKQWVLPLIELGVLSMVVYKLRQTILRYKNHRKDQPDFYTALEETVAEIAPFRLLGTLLASEIAVIYYGLICWKKRVLKEHEFSYHKKSGTRMVLGVFLFVILVETFAMHLLVEQWSVVLAWVLSGLSIYTALQLIGFMRSMSQRPISIEGEALTLRHGFFSEAKITLNHIKSVEWSRKASEGVLRLSSFGAMDDHNVVLHLREEQMVRQMYGRRKYTKAIAFFVDDKAAFKNMLEQRLGTIEN